MLEPAGFVKNNACSKIPFLGCNFKAGCSSQTCKLANAELTDSVSSESGRFGIRVIDGLGEKGGTFPKPFHVLLRWKARKKIRGLERKIERFMAMSSEEQAAKMRAIRQEGGD